MNNLSNLLDEFCTLVCGCNRRQIRVYFQHSRVGEQVGSIANTPGFLGPKLKDRRSILSMQSLTATQYVVLTPVFQDAKGNPAKPEDGSIKYATDNTDLLALTVGTITDPNNPTTFTADPAGISCKVAAVGALSSTPATVTLTADGDPSTAINLIMGTEEFTVTPGKATVVKLVSSPAAEQ